MDFILILIGALFAHISVNVLNEHYDFKSGLDKNTIKTPFSGGSGALLEQPQALNLVFLTGILSLGITIVLGLYLVYLKGLELLVPGIIGILLIVFYSGWINKKPILCLFAPGIAFGPVMVVGTYLYLTGAVDLKVVILSFMPLFLVSNLLLLNQLPDIKPDRQAGRKTFPIKYGINVSLLIFGLFNLAGGLILLLGIYFELFPKTMALSLIPLSLVLSVLFGAKKHADKPLKLVPYMSLNVAALILILSSIGLTLILERPMH